MLSDDDTRGAFSQPAFRRALAFYAGIFHDGLAPAMTNTQIANVWDEFARGLFALSPHKYEKHFCFMFPANSLWFHLRVKK